MVTKSFYFSLVLVVLVAVSRETSVAAQYPDATTDFLYNEATWPAEERAFCQTIRDVNDEARKYNALSDLQRAQSSAKLPGAEDIDKRWYALLSPTMRIAKWHGMLRPGRIENNAVRLEFGVTCRLGAPGSQTLEIVFASGAPSLPPYTEAGPKPFSDPVVQVFTKWGHGGAAEVSGMLYPSLNEPNTSLAAANNFRNTAYRSGTPFLTGFTKVALLPQPGQK